MPRRTPRIRTSFKLVGIQKTLQAISREVSRMKIRSAKGLIAAAIMMRRDMDKTPPLIPVDKGNLRNSWFMNVGKTGSVAWIEMGFTASYAIYVHESTTAKNFSRPGSGTKFFESALNRNKGAMLLIIAKSIKIGR